jgi:hypothetical protein
MMEASINMDDPLSTDLPPNPRATPEPEVGRKAPKAPKATKAAAGINAELKEIETKLAALLGRPAIPMHLAGDEWPATHVEENAAPLAKQIAQAARDNARLREQLLKLLRVGDGAGLVFAALAYLVPVLLYYGVVPAPPLVRSQLGVPERAAVRGRSLGDIARAEREHAERLAALVEEEEEAVRFAHAPAPAAEPPPENTYESQAGPFPPIPSSPA